MTRTAKATAERPGMVYLELDDRFFTAEIHMDEAARKRAVPATEAAGYGLTDAANVFRLISAGLSMGYFKSHEAGLISLAGICAQHFEAMGETAGDELLRLNQRLKDAVVFAPEDAA